ncbi:MAG: type II secretion system inner membrane protein GspF [Planctomycetes bacterium]|nr:type II secretion system inner membrane protein GspF [Planctomycetota bacterium]
MPVYQYTALTPAGKTQKGMIDADTPRDARLKLRVDKIHVTDMREVTDKAKRQAEKQAKEWGGRPFELPVFKLERKVNVRELATFSRQFATLLKSGIQLAEALRALVEQCANRDLEKVLRSVKEDITGGSSLAESLARHPRYFNDLYVNMVRAGEASGTLDQVLHRIAEYLQKQASLRGKVKAALTYPLIMIVVGTGVVIFLMSFVVPRITGILTQRNIPLPWITELLINVSSFFRDFWWMVLIAIAGALFILKGIIATDRGRLKFDTLLLKLPVIGGLFSKQAISRFAITFSTLLRSGLPALDSLKIVALVVNNARLTQVIHDIHGRILEGADIATPIKKSKVFPPMIGYMVAVGEQSGQLEDILDRLSESYEEEIDLSIQQLTALIEPVIIVSLAVVVGCIIAAVLLPMLDFSNI